MLKIFPLRWGNEKWMPSIYLFYTTNRATLTYWSKTVIYCKLFRAFILLGGGEWKTETFNKEAIIEQ